MTGQIQVGSGWKNIKETHSALWLNVPPRVISACLSNPGCGKRIGASKLLQLSQRRFGFVSKTQTNAIQHTQFTTATDSSDLSVTDPDFTFCSTKAFPLQNIENKILHAVC